MILKILHTVQLKNALIPKYSKLQGLQFALQNMKKWLSFIVMVLVAGYASGQDFIADQKKYSSVRQAFQYKEDGIVRNLKSYGLTTGEMEIIMIVHKAEKKLYIYAGKKSSETCKQVAEYDICALSGKLGPKRKQGDRQVPEGFYHINVFNPTSSYCLSLGVSYPNTADRRKSTAVNLGGDIYIHGSCATLGCLPMTDDKIREIYLYALFAKAGGQERIPIYIFPFEMTERKTDAYKKRLADDELGAFWDNLREGYDRFVKGKKELSFTVDDAGNYIFN